jgi:4-amino-4-deoxy-L-arabinose transferase-like glycosyltransferase
MQKAVSFLQKVGQNEKVLVRYLLGISLVIYFIFAFNHLTKFISADEHFWLPNSGAERIQNYWEAIAKRKWKDTRINDKPGITLAYTSGLALLFEKNPKDQFIYSKGPVDIYNPQKTEEINFWYRLPIVLISGLSFLFFFWIVRKITDSDWIALFSAVGMLSSPILLGMSQIVNPDSLFWIFGAACLLSFYAYLQKGGWKFSILAGIFLGLSLASKYVSVIFFPFFFLMMLAYYFFEFENFKKDGLISFSKRVAKNSLAYVGILAGGMLLFALMMPASFVEPKYFYAGTIGFPGMKMIFWLIMFLNLVVMSDAFFLKSKGLNFVFEKISFLRRYLPKIIYAILAASFLFVLFNWLTRNALLDLSTISFDTKRKDAFSELPIFSRYIMQFVALTFSLTPVALFSMLFLWIKGVFTEIRHRTLVFLLSVFYLIFYAAVVEQGLLVTVRYSIILFPFSMILVAIAIDELLSLKKGKETMKAVAAYLLFIVPLLLLQTFSLIDEYFFSGDLRDMIPRSFFMGILFLLAIAGLFLAKKVKIGEYFPWKLLQKLSKTKIFAIFLALNVFSILLISPFYFSYTNELLPKKYIISGAWGYGGYEAAQYMNKMPDAKNLTLWVDVYGVCEFFVGNCIHTAKIDPEKYKIDYYLRSLQATINPRFKTNMSENSIWHIYIDNRPKSFLKIYKEMPITE